jgi:hypothetical protein
MNCVLFTLSVVLVFVGIEALSWRKGSFESIPSNAILAGNETVGGIEYDLFVGR